MDGTSKSERIMSGVAKWCAYYRANVHRFAKDYLNVTLKWFQKILLVMMDMNTNFCYIASRGQGKTYLVALFCIIRCILYPGTAICVASKTRKQSSEIITKINDIFLPNSPNLRLEILDIVQNQIDSTIRFRNGSTITVVTANENARGKRANILIIDEFRMVDLKIINNVLRKFLIANRHPGYLDTPKYADYPTEENKEIYMSSAWYEASWSYDLVKSYAANMLTGRSYFICDLPYQLAIKERLLSRQRVENEMSESSFSDISWSMEMEGLFFSGSDGSLYQFDDINSSRKIKYCWYPTATSNLISDKRIKIPPKLHNEFRILSVDLALMATTKGKSNNDASAIFINQIQLREDGRCTKNIVYSENNEGLRSEIQALNIRRLFADFDCDYLVIDGRGLGIPIVDLLMNDIYDNETGVLYGALSCCNNPDYAERCMVKGAPKKIWVVTATAEFNSSCALGLREEFKQGYISLLSGEEEFEDSFLSLTGYSKLSLEDKLKMKLPYMNTSLLINELINLEYENKNNVIKVKEKYGMRKDRYSSLSYNIYVANEIAKKKHNENLNGSFDRYMIQFKQPETRKIR